MKRIHPQPTLYIILALLLLGSTACSAEVTVPDTPTPTPLVIITSTLPPTQTPRPSATPEPFTPTVAFVPIEGQTSSQLNVRNAPSETGDLLGTVEIFSKVQIVGKDPTSGWWMIVYPESPSGSGWITAQFVQATDTQNVPVIGGGGAGNSQGANVTPQTGAGPTIGPGSAVPPSGEAAPGLATALPDGDSAQSPAVSVSMSKVAVRAFNYSSDISFPEGDPEDWVRFVLEGELGQQTIVSVILNCTGSSTLNVDLIQNESILQGWSELSCGHPNQLQLHLFAGSAYYLRLTPTQGNSTIDYVSYTVIVQLSQ